MIIQGFCDSFVRELAGGVHAFATDAFRVALFKLNADIIGTYDSATTNYSQMLADEVIGTGYTAGGAQLTGGVITTVSGVGVVDFADLVFPNVTIITRGAMIYNSSKGNAAVALLDFGTDKYVQGNDLTLRMPQPTEMLALIRLRKQ